MIAPITRNRHFGDDLLLWVACLLALTTGAGIGFFRLEAAIDAQHDVTANVLAIARVDEQLLRQRGDLQRQEHRLDDIIDALDLNADHSTSVAHFVREAARRAAIHHTQLREIEEGRVEFVEPASAAGHSVDERLESLPFDVTVIGSYRDLLATIRDLSRAPMALHIEVAAIEQNQAVNDGQTGAAHGSTSHRNRTLARQHIDSAFTQCTRAGASRCSIPLVERRSRASPRCAWSARS
jgi:hypothetical protein